MGKLFESLKKQLETENRMDAEDCIKIYEKLEEVNNGSIWESQWRTLTTTKFKGFPISERIYKPSDIGYVFLKGIEVENKQ